MVSLPRRTSLSSVAFLVGVLLSLSLFALMGYGASHDIQQAIRQAEPWMTPVVTAEESQATKWILANTRERDVFVTDIFGGEHIMGNTLREGTEGGDWAIVPGVVEKMGAINEFYETANAERAHQIATKYNASYVLIPNRQVFAGFKWFSPERSKLQNPRYFERVFSNNTLEIYRVKES